MGMPAGKAIAEWKRRAEIRRRAEQIMMIEGAPPVKIEGTVEGVEYGGGGTFDWIFGAGSRTVMYICAMDNPEFDKWARENRDKVEAAYLRAEKEFESEEPSFGM